MKVLRWLGIAIGALICVLVVVSITARFSDGPIGPFAGGERVAGRVAESPADGSRFAAVQNVELQLLEPPRSRTVWIVVEDGAAYVPCGIPGFSLWKQWPHEAVEDGRAVLRVEGERYEGRLVKQDAPDLRMRLSDRIAEKYGVGGGETPTGDEVWFFRFEVRAV